MVKNNPLFRGGVKSNTKSQNDDINNANTDLIKQFNTTMQGMKEALENQTREIKSRGGTSDATAALITSFEEKLQSFGEQNADLISQHETLIKRMQRPTYQAGEADSDGVKGMTPGELFIKSAQYEQMRKNNSTNCNSVEIGSIFSSKEVQAMIGGGASDEILTAQLCKEIKSFREQKGLTSDSGSVGVLVRPTRLPDIVNKPFRLEHVRDLIRTSPTSVNGVEWLEETGFFNISTKLTTAITGTPTTLVVATISGFTPGQQITVSDGTNTEVKTIAPGGVSRSGDGGTLTVTVAFVNNYAIDATRVSSDLIAATPEGEKKPDGDVTIALRSATVKTIAKGLPITRQIMDDAPRLRSYIDGRLTAGMMTNEDWHLLYGSGTGNELQGMMTHANVQSYSWSAGEIGDTKYDAMRRAMTKGRLAEYPATGMILNPNDVEDLELLKNDNKGYMYVLNNGQVWRVPYVETTAINEGDFLTGNFQLAVELFDRENTNVRISESHSDFFMRNMIQLLMEQRLMLAYYRPEAMVVGSFDAAPS